MEPFTNIGNIIVGSSFKRKDHPFIVNFRCNQFEEDIYTKSFVCLQIYALPFTVYFICINKQRYSLDFLRFSQGALAGDQRN